MSMLVLLLSLLMCGFFLGRPQRLRSEAAAAAQVAMTGGSN